MEQKQALSRFLNDHKILPNNRIDYHMIVYEKSKERLHNYNIFKRKIPIHKFSAIDTLSPVNFKIYQNRFNGFLTNETYNEQIKVHRGKLGCNLSHFVLYRDILFNSQCYWHLIIEDDTKFDPNMVRKVSDVLRLINHSKVETNLIKLWISPRSVKNQYQEKHKISHHFYKAIPQNGTVDQLINLTGLKTIL